MKRENYNEQLILHAAEEEFIEKGFNRARTVTIARKAGVTPVVLHSYFRTKENLFQIVFLRKIRMVAVSLLHFYDRLPFEDALRKVIEEHFDILEKRPQLVTFLYKEIISNHDNSQILLNSLSGRLNDIFNNIEEILTKEAAKGTIQPVKAMDLILNVISFNVFTFIFYPLIREFMPDIDHPYDNNSLRDRRESNVQFVLNALRP